MAKITLTGTAAVTLDGRAFSNSGTYVADVSDVAEQTRDVTNTYIQVSGATTFVFLLVANLGTDDVIVRVDLGADYVNFGIPPGGHLLLPNAAEAIFENPAIRSVTSGGSRVYIAQGLAL